MEIQINVISIIKRFLYYRKERFVWGKKKISFSDFFQFYIESEFTNRFYFSDDDEELLLSKIAILLYNKR